MMRFILFTISFIFFTSYAEAQPSVRKTFHESVDAAQRKILMLDGKDDKLYVATSIPEVNLQLSRLVTKQVDDLQKEIDNDASLNENQKITYLRGIKEVLNGYLTNYRSRRIEAVQLLDLMQNFFEAIELDRKGESILPAVEKSEMELAQLLIDNFAFQKNKGIKAARDVIVLKHCQRNPQRILEILMRNPYNYYADSLIKTVAYRDQEELYNFASANNALGKKIQTIDDPLVKLIAKLARMNSGRQYFPFLDNLYKGKQTIEEIEKASANDVSYYKLLVKTQIDYADRLRQGDTPIIMRSLTRKLQQKAVEVFINEINALHDEKDPVRFKKLESLTAEELYYLAVMGETEIYTSSYTRGVYPRIFQKMKVPRADSLLINVKFDYFKKFIKVAAAYNTLDDFLGRMDKDYAVTLMRAFVNDLDKKSNLEDAVDVADSYGSISDKNLQALILQQVAENIKEARSEKARRIYSILNTIFLSKESETAAEAFEKLGIPPIYYMPNKMLRDTSGRIVIQQFFYGDDDGKKVFKEFVKQFTSIGWKMTSTPEWVVMNSPKGAVPVSIYSNRPLEHEEDLDEKAQKNLIAFLEEKNLQPTIVIHRGHSYFTNYTINQMPASAKVVFLGSCGSYHNLQDVLSICPNAHIIATKQVGTGAINLPLINLMTDDLRKGKDLSWPQLWTNLAKQLKKNNEFEDYIPPHKNLGAIFIMAYTKAEDDALDS